VTYVRVAPVEGVSSWDRSRRVATRPERPPTAGYAGAVTFIDRCPGCPYHGKAVGPRGDPASQLALWAKPPARRRLSKGGPFVGELAAS